MVKPGDPAPEFTAPAAHDDGVVSLRDYRGRSGVLLALFRGLYCPFCRHQMAQLAVTAEKLRPLGVETLGIVATAADRARSYFRRLRTPDANEMIDGAALQMALALDIPAVPGKARDAISRFDGYQASESDMADRERHQIQLTGQFLIDRDGIVRWCNRENAAGYAVFPSEKELLPAAERLGAS